MATKKPPKPPKAKQAIIPGTDADRNKELDKIGEALFEIRTNRMELTEQETKLAAQALAAMKAAKVREYCFTASDGERFRLYVEDEEKAKIKRVQVPKPKEATVS